MLGLIAGHIAVVTVMVYGMADSRLARPLRWRVFRWAYARDGANLDDESWSLLRDEPWRWDEFVKEDDDPPFYAVLVRCHWCSGLYCSLIAAVAWAGDGGAWDWPMLSWLVAYGVVGAVLVLAVIARLAR